MKELLEKSLEKAIDYSSYQQLIKNLLAEGKSTGKEQSEALLNFSNLNDRRMSRLDKTLKLDEEILQTVNNLPQKHTLLVISEGWCGDAAQVVPVLHKISESTDKVSLKMVFRDENEELMNQFLTNGAKSIPKVIVLDEENTIVTTWGSRPSVATKMVDDYKKEHGGLDAEFKKNLQIWYNKDKGKSVQNDFAQIFTAAQS